MAYKVITRNGVLCTELELSHEIRHDLQAGQDQKGRIPLSGRWGGKDVSHGKEVIWMAKRGLTGHVYRKPFLFLWVFPYSIMVSCGGFTQWTHKPKMYSDWDRTPLDPRGPQAEQLLTCHVCLPFTRCTIVQCGWTSCVSASGSLSLLDDFVSSVVTE